MDLNMVLWSALLAANICCYLDDNRRWLNGVAALIDVWILIGCLLK